MEVPYLKSVASQWDMQSPKYENTKLVSYSSIKSLLKVDPAVLASTGQDYIKVLKKTNGNRVGEVRIGDKVFTGRYIREQFDLKSSDFTIELKKDGLLFHTKGYGHGVGMSQYGANGMAKEGKTAQDIIKHYYTGVEITNIEKWIKPVANKGN